MRRPALGLGGLLGLLGLLFAASAISGPILRPGWPRYIFDTTQLFFYGPHAAAADLDGDGIAELCVGAGNKVYLMGIDGEPLPGWPKVNPNSSSSFRLPALGDIDGDGRGDVVTWSRGAPPVYLYAWNIEGEALPGFPIAFPGEVIGGGGAGPTLFDIDGDGILDIIHSSEGYWPEPGSLVVRRGDGSILPGWPQEIDTLSWSGYYGAGDIDGDLFPEIITGPRSPSRLFAFHNDGTFVEGWPVLYDPGMETGGPAALADFDGDGDAEIAMSQSRIYPQFARFFLWNGDGMNLWPPAFEFEESAVYTNPAIADLDSEGKPEIVHPLLTRVWAFGADADTVPGFPLELEYGMGIYGASPITGDIDGDLEMEILLSVNRADSMPPDTVYTGYLYGYNMDGTQAKGFPLRVQGIAWDSDPVLIDADSDGTLDLFVFSTWSERFARGWAYLFTLEGAVHPELVEWGQAGHDAQHTSNYDFRPPVGIAEETQGGFNHHAITTLLQNFPNPFNPNTTISFDVQSDKEITQTVNLTIYDIRGRRVKVLIDRGLEAGRHRVIWDGKDEKGIEVASGIYFYQVKAGGYIYTRKMTLMR
ncbi:MAG: FG-GAP-like repeat-containing protein [Candidatus Glassbacteria bacterium]